MKARYIFGASLPRSGTKLYTYALSVNPKVLIASNPNVELFRFLKMEYSKRFKIIKKLKNFQTNFMLEDYYGPGEKFNLLKYILNSNLDIRFSENLKEFQNKSFIRSKLEINDLSEDMKKISGSTYKEIIKNQIKIIKKRNKHKQKWIGFSESWAIEFFPAIARSFPNAKFLVNLRDPRATIYANQNITKKTRRAQILSYSRHFRKQVALISYYLKSKLLKNKIHVFCYESLVFNPKDTIKRICDFLGTKFDNRSIEFKNFYNYDTKKRWRGDSHTKIKISNFDEERTYFWKKKIDDDTLKYIEFLCYHELKACGYKLFFDLDKLLIKNKKKIKKIFKSDLKKKASWRSDSGNIDKEIKFEFLRHSQNKIIKKRNIQKYFLTQEFYKMKLKHSKMETWNRLLDYNKALNFIQ